MKVSYNWLKEYVKRLPPPDELAKQLTMAGLEVEGIEALDKGVSGVVTAQILSVEKHPNADRLSFCKVKTDKGIHSIVCGARNMKDGDNVALALPGATLPGGIKIAKTKIRGVESEGMMCSEVELGLKDVSEGIMILPHDIPIGKDFTDIMGMNDSILNVNVTPNRPDCLSIIGIAREVAAIKGRPLKTEAAGKSLRIKAKDTKKFIPVSIKDPSLCKRYAAMLIENIRTAPSPDWLKRRLESIGLRSINNVVDITNYVMIEYGQPLHAFDYDLVSGKQIIVRRADENEKIETIDGFKRALTQEMLVIADNEKPIALAGIMGGKETEINDATKNILLESACFDPSCVRKTSKALGILTESSYRFERGVDIEGVAKALKRAAQMIVELAGGDIMANGAVDNYQRQYKPPSIKVGLSRINKILGINIHKKEVEDCFNNLGIGFKPVKLKNKEDAMWDVAPPSYRFDLIKDIDIIEEIARLYGYEKIPTTLPAAGLSTAKTKWDDLAREKARDILTNNGFLEAVNYSFVSPRLFEINASDIKISLKILNPLTEEQSIMRQSLIPGLLQTLQHNLNHNNRDIKVFEIGRIFIPKEKETEERNMISGLISGLRCKEAWNTVKDSADFYDIKGAVEQILTGLGVERYVFAPRADIPFLHLGKAAVIEADDKRIGIVGEVHPDIMQSLDIKQPAYIFELDMQIIAAVASGPKRYSPIPKYPMIVRDAAMIVERGVPFQKIYNAIKGLGIKLLEEVNVFDVYYGKNIPDDKYSMALRFMYRSPDRTLTDDEVTNVHSTVLENLKARFGVEVRGE